MKRNVQSRNQTMKNMYAIELYDILVLHHVVYSEFDSRLNHVTGGPLVSEILRPWLSASRFVSLNQSEYKRIQI